MEEEENKKQKISIYFLNQFFFTKIDKNNLLKSFLIFMFILWSIFKIRAYLFICRGEVKIFSSALRLSYIFLWELKYNINIMLLCIFIIFERTKWKIIIFWWTKLYFCHLFTWNFIKLQRLKAQFFMLRKSKPYLLSLFTLQLCLENLNLHYLYDKKFRLKSLKFVY